MIWKFAVRPTLPGAHVFRVYNSDDSKHADPQHETTRDHRYISDHALFCWGLQPRLAAPQCLPRRVGGFDPSTQAAAPISWTRNNPSAYLIDSGLWTACKESLVVIEQEFQSPARRRKAWSHNEVESFRKQLRTRFRIVLDVAISPSSPTKISSPYNLTTSQPSTGNLCGTVSPPGSTTLKTKNGGK